MPPEDVKKRAQPFTDLFKGLQTPAPGSSGSTSGRTKNNANNPLSRFSDPTSVGTGGLKVGTGRSTQPTPPKPKPGSTPPSTAAPEGLTSEQQARFKQLTDAGAPRSVALEAVGNIPAQPVEGTPTKPPPVSSSEGIRKEASDAGISDEEVAEADSEEDLRQKIEDRKKAITGDTTFPTRGDREQEFEDLREEHGIADLENESVNLQSQIEAEMANLRAFRGEELAGPGTLGFARGRISEEERAVMERVDFLNRRLNTVNNRLKLKNQNIRDVMKFREMNFEDAKEEYEFEFNQNLSILNSLVKEEEKELLNERTTYQTLSTMLKDVPVDELDQNTLDRIEVLESKLGIPEGTFAAMKSVDPDAKIIASGTDTDESGRNFAWFVTRGDDGAPQVKTVFTGGVTKTDDGDDEEENREFELAREWIEEVKLEKTRAEMEAELRQETDLKAGDISSILDAAGIGKESVELRGDELTKVAENNLEPHRGTLKGIEDALKDAVQAIRNNKQVKINGKVVDLSPRQIEDLVSEMTRIARTKAGGDEIPEGGF